MIMDIQHDKDEMKFYVMVEGKEAKLLYRKLDDGTLDFFSTFVPPEGRGMGIAGQLTDFGVAYAKANGFKVRPTCSYVEKYFDSRDELSDLRSN